MSTRATDALLPKANSPVVMRWPLEKIKSALIAELKGPNRPRYVTRLHQRFTTLRRDIERKELLAAAKKQEIPGFLNQ